MADGGFPRRARMDLWSPAEKAIGDAVDAVEAMPAHELLTQAVILLGDAKDKVADWVDSHPDEPASSHAVSGEEASIDALVTRFATALRAKLYESEAKYGWQGAWKRDGWEDELRACIREHVEKGDPRDVAAYCAFALHHGWSLARPTPPRSETPFGSPRPDCPRCAGTGCYQLTACDPLMPCKCGFATPAREEIAEESSEEEIKRALGYDPKLYTAYTMGRIHGRELAERDARAAYQEVNGDRIALGRQLEAAREEIAEVHRWLDERDVPVAWNSDHPLLSRVQHAARSESEGNEATNPTETTNGEKD